MRGRSTADDDQACAEKLLDLRCHLVNCCALQARLMAGVLVCHVVCLRLFQLRLMLSTLLVSRVSLASSTHCSHTKMELILQTAIILLKMARRAEADDVAAKRPRDDGMQGVGDDMEMRDI